MDAATVKARVATKKTAKAVFFRLTDNRIVSLPAQYVTADVEEFVSEVRLPRWLALDRGL